MQIMRQLCKSKFIAAFIVIDRIENVSYGLRFVLLSLNIFVVSSLLNEKATLLNSSFSARKGHNYIWIIFCWVLLISQKQIY